MSTEHPDRLSDKQVQHCIELGGPRAEGTWQVMLAREVQRYRAVAPTITAHLDGLSMDTDEDNALLDDIRRLWAVAGGDVQATRSLIQSSPIDALCARHDITVDGIVALVDAALTAQRVLGTRSVVIGGNTYTSAVTVTSGLRRLARQEGPTNG